MDLKSIKLRNIYSSIIGLLLFALFLCIGTFNAVYKGYNISNFLLFFTLFVSVIFCDYGRIQVNEKTLYMVIFMYAAFSVSTVYALVRGGDISYFIKFCVPLIIVLICFKRFKDEQNIKYLTKMLMCANICACLRGIYDMYYASNEDYVMFVGSMRIVRMTGTFDTANVFACFLALTLPFALYEVSYFKLKNKAFFYVSEFIVLLLNLFCIYQSRSRWTIVCLFIMVVGYMMKIVLKEKNKKNVVRFFLLSLLFAAVVFILHKKVNITGVFEHRASNDMRVGSLKQALAACIESFPAGEGLGYGVANFTKTTILDSGVICLLLDTGVVGVFFYCALVWRVLTRLYGLIKKENKTYLKPYFAMLCVFCLEMVLENIIYNSTLNLMFGIAICLALI